MPTKNTTTTAEVRPTSKLNPTVAPAWRNDKFGFGAILSKAINEEGYNQVMKNLQIGSKLLVKKSKRPSINKDGEEQDQYFIEILPPWDKEKDGRFADKPTSELD